MARSKLERMLDELEALHGAVPKPKLRDPFALALWENAAYLVDDERRANAFAALEKRVGLDPRSVAAARIDVLLEIATLGGIHAPSDCTSARKSRSTSATSRARCAAAARRRDAS